MSVRGIEGHPGFPGVPRAHTKVLDPVHDSREKYQSKEDAT